MYHYEEGVIFFIRHFNNYYELQELRVRIRAYIQWSLQIEVFLKERLLFRCVVVGVIECFLDIESNLVDDFPATVTQRHFIS